MKNTRLLGILAVFALVLMAFVGCDTSTGGGSSSSTPAPGPTVYRGTAHGVNNAPVVPIEVSLTVDGADKISWINIAYHNESTYYQTNVRKAVANPGTLFYKNDGLFTENSMAANLLGLTKAEVIALDPTTGNDVTSGATYSSRAIRLAAIEALTKYDPPSAITAGTYSGRAYSRYGNGNQLKLTAGVAADGTITVTSIKTEADADFTDLKSDTTPTDAAVIAALNTAQTFNIPSADFVTLLGAVPATGVPSNSQKAVYGAMTALKDVMLQAGLPVSAFPNPPAHITGTAALENDGTGGGTVAAPKTTDKFSLAGTSAITGYPTDTNYVWRFYLATAAALDPTDTTNYTGIWSGQTSAADGTFAVPATSLGRKFKVKLGTIENGYFGSYIESAPSGAEVAP